MGKNTEKGIGPVHSALYLLLVTICCPKGFWVGLSMPPDIFLLHLATAWVFHTFFPDWGSQVPKRQYSLNKAEEYVSRLQWERVTHRNFSLVTTPTSTWPETRGGPSSSSATLWIRLKHPQRFVYWCKFGLQDDYSKLVKLKRSSAWLLGHGSTCFSLRVALARVGCCKARPSLVLPPVARRWLPFSFPTML